MRAGAGTNYSVVGTLSSGNNVPIVGENEDGSWLWVLLEDGTEGWVSAGLVNEQNAALEVEMVLVPAGCFMMGSEDDDDDETPVHEQCFDEPFWIDRYEVTNEQYGSLGCLNYSSEPDQPSNCVDWFEAKAHCESWGARLPTEAEWEYTARGPDNLVYPWGNDFVAGNVVYMGNSSQTAEVGSRPGGMSWVGAYDMSGNVWEWVSTIYQDYPYSADDGRESNNDTSARVVRGESFLSTVSSLRATNRRDWYPAYGNELRGFRCARDYSSDS